MTKIDKKYPIAWPIVLIGFPVSILILLITVLSGVDYEKTAIGFISIMSSFLLCIIFGVVNWFFALISIPLLWSDLKGLNKLKYIIIAIFTNALSGYMFIGLWKEKKVNMLTIKHKSIFDAFSFLFYMFTFFALVIPVFITQQWDR